MISSTAPISVLLFIGKLSEVIFLIFFQLQARNMLQEALRNSEAKKYLQISNADENPIDSNLFGLTEDKFEYKESKRKHIQQVIKLFALKVIDTVEKAEA